MLPTCAQCLSLAATQKQHPRCSAAIRCKQYKRRLSKVNQLLACQQHRVVNSIKSSGSFILKASEPPSIEWPPPLRNVVAANEGFRYLERGPWEWCQSRFHLQGNKLLKKLQHFIMAVHRFVCSKVFNDSQPTRKTAWVQRQHKQHLIHGLFPRLMESTGFPGRCLRRLAHLENGSWCAPTNQTLKQCQFELPTCHVLLQEKCECSKPYTACRCPA